MAIYHALSLQQPWANLICQGQKTIETRTWSTSYRGELLICASKKPNIPPVGCTVCLVQLVDCRPMTTDDQIAACIDLYPRAVAWELRNIRPVANIPITGQLGIFQIELDDLPLLS